MNQLKVAGTFIRSKIPLDTSNVFNRPEQNQETIFLIPNVKPKSSLGHQYNKLDEGDESYSYQNLPQQQHEAENAKFDMNPKLSNNKINAWQASYNVTNAIQGMFVVSLPYAVARGGWWSLLAMLFISYVCSYTGRILVDCLYDDKDDEVVDTFEGKLSIPLPMSQSKRRNRIYNSYVDIAEEVLGSRIGGNIVNIAQNIELLMTCILYLVLCGDLFVGSFPEVLDHASWTIISSMFLIPCAFISSLKLISKLSLCNAFVHLIINILIMLYCILKIQTWDLSKVSIKLDIYSFPISLGIIVFSYTSQIFLPTMEINMIDRTQFDSMLNLTHFVAAIFKATFGLVCFLTWQESTEEVITNNLPTKEFKLLINMILVIKALLSFPLPYFAAVDLLEKTLFLQDQTDVKFESLEPELMELHSVEPNKNNKPQSPPLFSTSCYEMDGDIKFWAICLRICLILSTLFLAIFIPHFALLMGLIGSITGTFLSLIWPCYFHLKLKKNSLTTYQKVVDIVIIIFGLLISIIGVYYSSCALYKALNNQPISLSSQYYKKNNMLIVKGNGGTNETII